MANQLAYYITTLCLFVLYFYLILFTMVRSNKDYVQMLNYFYSHEKKPASSLPYFLNPIYFLLLLFSILNILNLTLSYLDAFNDKGYVLLNVARQSTLICWLASFFRQTFAELFPIARTVEQVTINYMYHGTISLFIVLVITVLGFFMSDSSHSILQNYDGNLQSWFLVCITVTELIYCIIFLVLLTELLSDAQSVLVDFFQLRFNTLKRPQGLDYHPFHGFSVDVTALDPETPRGCSIAQYLHLDFSCKVYLLCVLYVALCVYKLSHYVTDRSCVGKYSRCDSSTHDRNVDTTTDLWLPDFIMLCYWFWFFAFPTKVRLQEDMSRMTSTSLPRDLEKGSDFRALQLSDMQSSIISNALFDLSSSASSASRIPISSSPAATAAKRRTLRMGRTQSSKKMLVGTSPSSNNMEMLNHMPDVQECRELTIRCTEMILIEKLRRLPIPTLFSGRNTFVVLSYTYANDDELLNENVAWVELGRSDLVIGQSSPAFAVTFMLPYHNKFDQVKWRFEIYNAARNIKNFRVDEAILEEQVLIGIVDLTLEDFYPQRRESYMGRESEFDVRPSFSALERPDIIKDIRVKNYADNFSRLGGTAVITIRHVRPFCQLISNLNKISSTKAESNGVIMRGFCITTHRRGHVFIREELLESPYSYSVPAAYMKALQSERMFELEALTERFGDYDELWMQEMLASVENQIAHFGQCSTEFEKSDICFKSSADKGDKKTRNIPLNLHLHILTASGAGPGAVAKNARHSDYYFTFDFVTVGAFAAHANKFKAGGIWHYMKKFGERYEALTSTPREEGASKVFLPDEAWNVSAIQNMPLDKKLFQLAYKARDRLDSSLSQCLAAVATGFVSRVQLMSPEALERLPAIGMLIQFESLLSTQGAEIGMLADMYMTVLYLQHVHVRIHEVTTVTDSNNNKGPEASVCVMWQEVEGQGQCLILDMGFKSDWYNRMPLAIREGKSVPIVPVLFSVGINEMQSYAETVSGKTALYLQDVINADSLQRMEAYTALVVKFENGEFDFEPDVADVRLATVEIHEHTELESGGDEKDVSSESADSSSAEPVPRLTIDKRDSMFHGSDENSSPRASMVTGASRRRAVMRSMSIKRLVSEKRMIGPLSDISEDSVRSARQSSVERKSKRRSTRDRTAVASIAETGDSDDDSEFAGSDDEDEDRIDSVDMRRILPEEQKPSVVRHMVRRMSTVFAPDRSSISTPAADTMAQRQTSTNTVGRATSSLKKRVSNSTVESLVNSIVTNTSLLTEIRESPTEKCLKSEEEQQRIAELQHRLHDMIGELREAVIVSIGAGGKPWKILTLAAKLTRALDGVRMTSCKSAKDRTGMSVTLEEKNMIEENFELKPEESKHLLDILRIHGVRLENAKKNIGKAKFAFNSFQRRFLPDEYIPPASIAGSVKS